MMDCILNHFVTYNPHHPSTFGLRHEIDFFHMEISIRTCSCHPPSIHELNEDLHELFSFLFTSNEPSSNEHPMSYHLQVYCLLNSVSHHTTLRVDAFDLDIVAERVVP